MFFLRAQHDQFVCVVMARAPGVPLSACAAGLRCVAADVLAAHVDRLRQAGIVHGDLRSPNVLVACSAEVKADDADECALPPAASVAVAIVDWSWAGLAGQDTYRVQPEPSLRWNDGSPVFPKDTALGCKLRVEHDARFVRQHRAEAAAALAAARQKKEDAAKVPISTTSMV